MTVARSKIVDVAVTPWYHVISKTVRGALLLGEGDIDRKQWIEDRIELLVKCFAISTAGFAILDNHLHLLVRLEPERVDRWSDREVVRRWFMIYPPRGAGRRPLAVTRELIRQKSADKKFLKKVRCRLANLGWFMKCLKEPLARLANREDGTTGAFWQSRYKSIAILDVEALVATCAYIDLNVVAAGLERLAEDSPHTSIRARVDHCRRKGRIGDLQAARHSSFAGCEATRGLEDDSLWLCPIEDRRQRDANARAGMLDGFSLGSYLRLVDWTSRLARPGKARVSADIAALLDRLGSGVENWRATMKRLFTASRLTGVAFAFQRERLRDAARHRGCHHLANLSGCPA